jgi:hypothetical protein
MTAYPDAAASMFYWDGLKSINNITFYRNGIDINKFNVCLVMTYDHDLVPFLKNNFQNLKIGLIDPRNFKVLNSAHQSDFLICDSLEMEDYWRIAEKPIFRYVEYPNFNSVTKKHLEKEKLIIGYHGNQIHLECMSQNVTPALEKLSDRYNLELLVMHSESPPKGSEKWVPKNIKIRHIPWSSENYLKELSSCDVGIVPNNLVHNDFEKKSNETKNSFNYSEDDFSLRFKMPSNPGRIIVFGKLGIPCVADFYPSAISVLSDNRGLVAHNTQGWFWSLDRLLSSSSLRQEISNNFSKFINENFDFEIQNQKLIKFLEKI